MAPQTDIVDIAARAFAPSPARARTRWPSRYDRGPRGGHARGLLWVRITLFVVVAALLLSIASSSKARATGHEPARASTLPR